MHHPAILTTIVLSDICSVPGLTWFRGQTNSLSVKEVFIFPDYKKLFAKAPLCQPALASDTKYIFYLDRKRIRVKIQCDYRADNISIIPSIGGPPTIGFMALSHY